MATPTTDQILLLKLGDIMEVPSFMSSLTPEATIMQVDAIPKNGIGFRVLFCGVLLGRATLTIAKGGEASWNFK